MKVVIVGGVEANSPAAAAGLKANDIILKLGDKAIDSMSQLRRELYKYKSGDSVDVVIVRGGKKQTLKLTFTDYQVPKFLPQARQQAQEEPQEDPESIFPMP